MQTVILKSVSDTEYSCKIYGHKISLNKIQDYWHFSVNGRVFPVSFKDILEAETYAESIINRTYSNIGKITLTHQ